MDLSKTKNDKEPSKLALGQFSSNFTFDETTKTYSIRAGNQFCRCYSQYVTFLRIHD